jgi:hypothetical protein
MVGELRRIPAEGFRFTEDRQRCSDLAALPLCARKRHPAPAALCVSVAAAVWSRDEEGANLRHRGY